MRTEKTRPYTISLSPLSNLIGEGPGVRLVFASRPCFRLTAALYSSTRTPSRADLKIASITRIFFTASSGG
jgi:hypothetical protein